MINSFKINKLFLIYCFITICLQMTEVKIYSIKISEILLLFSIIPFLNIAFRHEKKIIYLFTFFLLKSLLLNPLHQFFPLSEVETLLKSPYIISFARFFELLACYILLNLCTNFFTINKQTAIEFLNTIIIIQFYIAIIFFIIYIIYIIGAINLNYGEDDFIVYNTSQGFEVKYRINGFYVEGGPLGTFYASMFCLFDIFNKQKFRILKLFIIIFIIFGTQSKAGILFLTAYFLINYFYLNRKNISYFKIFSALFIFFFLFTLTIYVSYLNSINNLEMTVQLFQISGTNEIDKNHFMGRIAAIIILPNIFINNFFFGIGLGNYALVRNNPMYRDLIPEVPYWDLHGFGGLVDLVIEGGVVILILFLLYLLNIWKKCNDTYQKKTFITFVLCFLFGVQIYFLYPWFIFGFLIFLQNSRSCNIE